MSLTKAEEIEYLDLLEEDEKEISRKSHIEFMYHCWQKGQNDPLIEGFHTLKICEAVDEAFESFRAGESTFFLVNIHFRSGKSDMMSRYLAPHFLGEFPDCEILQTTYQSDLTKKFTGFARNVFRSESFHELYPDIVLSKESNAKGYWEVVDKKTNKPTHGKLFGSGLNSGITGSGGHLLILDDYLAGRKEAESKVIRDGIWDAFKEDFMTRRAPTSMVFVVATQWHWDDISGRIREEMKKNPKFPQFKELVFPAKAKDYKGEGEYPGEYLFPERYGKDWYESEYATLGLYGSAALLDCNPSRRLGAILSIDGIVYHERDDSEIPSRREAQWARIWDLAHTEKQRIGEDPDYTSGTLLCFTYVKGDIVPHLWIKDVHRNREKAKKRDVLIKGHARRDGVYTKQAIESSIDSKDAYEYISDALPDIKWKDIQIAGDKAVRAAPLEKIFEAEGHVHVINGGWVEDWFKEVLNFDGTGAEHDDQIDNMSAGYKMLVYDKRKKGKGINDW